MFERKEHRRFVLQKGALSSRTEQPGFAVSSLQRALFAFTPFEGSRGPELSVIAAVLFSFARSPQIYENNSVSKGGTMWRPLADPIESVRLRVYRRIVRYYLRYALIRSAKFTNRKDRAQTIAFYTLVTTCLLARHLGHARHLGALVDMMVRVAARDQSRQRSRTRRGQNTSADLVEPLLGDKTMRKLAQAVNMLDGPTCELLVLCHIELMGVRQLSLLFAVPPAQIEARLAEGRETLAGNLQQLCSDNKADACDVALLLNQFRTHLDADSADRLAGYALSYLAQWEKDNRSAPPCCNFN